jgi:hypothetical protein
MTDEPNPFREAVAAAVNERGVRVVAREANLADMTVRAFVQGSPVRRQSLQRFQTWASSFREREVQEGVATEVQKREPPPVWRGAGGLHGSGG